LDQTAFVLAAIWADETKKPEARYTKDGQHPDSPAASANIGYIDHLQHRYWHFIDAPFSPDHTPLIPPGSPSADPDHRLPEDAVLGCQRRRQVL
jgi:hypothetical protein